MRTMLTNMLSGLNANLMNFQLLNIVLPTQFSATIQNIEKYKQDLTTAQFVLQQAQNYANGMIQQATQENGIILQIAQGYQQQLNAVSLFLFDNAVEYRQEIRKYR